MNENPTTQQYSNGKPVNINISFNISRKQVMQNINPLEHDKTYNFRQTIQEDFVNNTNKTRNVSYRPLKTPQLAQTDRQIYSKDLQFPRPTEELKRKKKRKKSSGDYTGDKTSNFPFYPVDLDKSLPSHKRGYTTTAIKKTTSGTKYKKQPIKIDHFIKHGNTLPISALIGQEKKGQHKNGKIQKNLKNILAKLITNEQSKRSLPLPSVPSKSKYNQSTSLTSKKMSTVKSGKKRHSKSHIMNKEKVHHLVGENVNSSLQQIQVFKNPAILQKLSNFKSDENSILISEIDHIEDKNANSSPRERGQGQKRIVIKTDQSIECIDQIHNWQKDYFKGMFFEDKGTKSRDSNGVGNNRFLKKQKQQSDPDYSDTLSLIQTYVKLLNAPQQVSIRQPYHQRYDKNVNEKVQIYDGQDYINAKNHQDAQNLLRKKNLIDEEQDISLSRTYAERMIDDYEQEQAKMQYSVTKPVGRDHNQDIESIEAISSQIEKQILIQRIQPEEQKQSQAVWESSPKNQIALSPCLNSHQQSINTSNFRPFISSQMGRQDKQNTVQSQERARVNELKKHEIEKWSNLLEYIKSNMNSETNTQQVLQQVYEYLSQAKVDLIREGRNIVEGRGESMIGSNKRDQTEGKGKNQQRQRLDEQFTNKLSSQLQKSLNQQLISSSHQLQSFNEQHHLSHNNLNRRQSHQCDYEFHQCDHQSHQNDRQSHQNDHLSHQSKDKGAEKQAQSFKSDYESEEEQEIKFMNLSTIESALKNRFNQLAHKKDKEIQRIGLLLEQNKLTHQQHEQQKSIIEKQFKAQTNQILTVKKNIWKGYNEAKGILDKSYINSRIEEEYKGQLYQRSNNHKNLSKKKKDRKMMKCLSESYLNKKKIDYKNFIEEQQRKRQEQSQHHVIKRHRGQQNFNDQDDEDSQQNHDEHDKDQDSSSGQSLKGDIDQLNPLKHYQNDKNQNETNSQGGYSQDQEKSIEKDQNSQQQSNSNFKNSQNSDSPAHLNSKNPTKHNLIDDEFQKISKKLNKLKELHETALANQTKHHHPNLSSSSKEQSIESHHSHQQENNINQFTYIRQHYQQESSSPVMVFISPDSSVHYEEIEKNLRSDQSSKSESEEQYIYDDENARQVNHSSSEEDRDLNDNQYEKYNSAQHRLLENQDDYSDEQQRIIAKQLSEAHRFGSLSSTKNSQPLKSTLQQLKQSQHLLEPKPISKLSQFSTNQQVPQPADKSISPVTQALYKKLKYLTEQDREDIFEFMFLDLCIELYQQPCLENKIMNSINKHVAKQFQLTKRKKGVKTNLNVVKDYLKRFCGYLIRTNKNLLDNLNVPMGPTAIEMLKYMHENEDFDQEPIQGQGIVSLIVPVSVFDTFERSLLPTLEFEKYYDNEEKQLQRVNFLKNILHIHNKALFDALNEFLDHQRPFGIWGKPFPWKKSSCFAHKFTDMEQEERLKKSAQKVVQACSYVCGLLVDKEQSLVGTAKLSEGYIEQIRQDRISRMLANEMIENEQRWVFYDDQETEVLVQTSNYVYNMLLRDVLEDVMRLKSLGRSIQEVNETNE